MMAAFSFASQESIIVMPDVIHDPTLPRVGMVPAESYFFGTDCIGKA